jgi:hypothetical protein
MNREIVAVLAFLLLSVVAVAAQSWTPSPERVVIELECDSCTTWQKEQAVADWLRERGWTVSHVSRLTLRRVYDSTVVLTGRAEDIRDFTWGVQDTHPERWRSDHTLVWHGERIYARWYYEILRVDTAAWTIEIGGHLEPLKTDTVWRRPVMFEDDLPEDEDTSYNGLPYIILDSIEPGKERRK